MEHVEVKGRVYLQELSGSVHYFAYRRYMTHAWVPPVGQASGVELGVHQGSVLLDLP